MYTGSLSVRTVGGTIAFTGQVNVFDVYSWGFTTFITTILDLVVDSWDEILLLSTPAGIQE